MSPSKWQQRKNPLLDIVQVGLFIMRPELFCSVCYLHSSRGHNGGQSGRWPLLVSASPQWHNLSSAKCQRKAEIVEGTNNNYLKLFVHIIPRKNGSKPILKVRYPRNKGTDTGKCWVTGFKLHKKAWMGVQFETWRGFTLHIYCICILCKFQHKSVKYIIVWVYCTQPTCNSTPWKSTF